MPIERDHLLNYRIPAVTQKVTRRDTILYALGIGLGDDPTDPRQLRFLYEQGLSALPTITTALAPSVSWMRRPDTGIDPDKVVHAEQSMVLHRALPVEGTFLSECRVLDVLDKGPGRGAVIHQERLIYDDRGQLISTLRHTNFYLGGGGFGGPPGPAMLPFVPPNRAPDIVDLRRTLPQAALIYRLSGDYEPMHADPSIAAKMGFSRPILHGLCTFGIAGYSLLARCCDFDPTRLRSMEVRFTAPVLPGETLLTEIWRMPDGAVFRSRVAERDIIVLDRGYATLTN